MVNANIDRKTLRDLADGGNETALDRLADLADKDGDLEELSELLDEGCMRAGFQLTRRAVQAGDLRELQRISDAGYEEAGQELERLLRAPIGWQREGEQAEWSSLPCIGLRTVEPELAAKPPIVENPLPSGRPSEAREFRRPGR